MDILSKDFVIRQFLNFSPKEIQEKLCSEYCECSSCEILKSIRGMRGGIIDEFSRKYQQFDNPEFQSWEYF